MKRYFMFQLAVTSIVVLLAAETVRADSIFLSTKNPTSLAGLSFRDDDIVKYDTAAATAVKIFDGTALLTDMPSTDEDVDAVHILSNGNIIFSTTNGTSIAGLSFDDGDLVEYDPVAATASLFFDESLFSGNEDIDAVHVLANGNIVLSTTTSATLGGLTFNDDDIIEYDPVAAAASLLFDGTTLLTNMPGDEDVDAVHILSNGNIILSTISDGEIAGLSFKDDDLVEYDPVAATAVKIFDGTALLLDTSNDEDINAVFYNSTASVPEPSTLLLIGSGLVGLAGLKRKLKS